MRREWPALPVKYDGHGTIYDARGGRVLDIRGWGHMTGKGHALGLSHEEAAKMQDDLAARLVSFLNGDETPKSVWVGEPCERCPLRPGNLPGEKPAKDGG